jgi:hypothetical protein
VRPDRADHDAIAHRNHPFGLDMGERTDVVGHALR